LIWLTGAQVSGGKSIKKRANDRRGDVRVTTDQAFGLLVALIIAYFSMWLTHSLSGDTPENFSMEPIKSMILVLAGYLFGCR
jgi:hypothetical protein